MTEGKVAGPSSSRSRREIVIYHVGGEDGYGPITSILERMKKNTRLVVFEAREDTSDASFVQHMERDGLPVSIIRTGIDETRGKADFYVNKFPLSSSLLPPSPLAATEDPGYGHCFTWSENVELDRMIRVDTISIDELVGAGAIPPPDVISIDAQGAELRILRGAANTLSEHVSCVVSEVEFHEIYLGQGLFDDQMRFLGQNGIRLFKLLNQQQWHPGPRCGDGFLTVAEAVFLKCVKDIPKDDRGCVASSSVDSSRLVRLAAVAMCFGALSYSVQLMTIVHDRDPAMYENLRGVAEYCDLVQLADLIRGNLDHYREDKNFFLKNIEFASRLAAGEPVLAESGFSMRRAPNEAPPPPDRDSVPPSEAPSASSSATGFFRKLVGR